MLGEANSFGIGGNFDAQEKKFSINFSQVKITFCLSLHYYNGDNSYFLLTEKKSLSLKLIIVEPQVFNGSCLRNKRLLYY